MNPAVARLTHGPQPLAADAIGRWFRSHAHAGRAAFGWPVSRHYSPAPLDQGFERPPHRSEPGLSVGLLAAVLSALPANVHGGLSPGMAAVWVREHQAGPMTAAHQRPPYQDTPQKCPAPSLACRSPHECPRRSSMARIEQVAGNRRAGPCRSCLRPLASGAHKCNRNGWVLSDPPHTRGQKPETPHWRSRPLV